MKRWFPFFILCVLSLFLFGSCRHTVTATEYIPVTIDTGAIEPIFELRPDNDVEIIVDIQDVADVVKNSAVYLRQWKLWQSYAEGLEEVLRGLEETYGPETV